MMWLVWIELCLTFLVAEYSLISSLVKIGLKLYAVETFPGGVLDQVKLKLT